MHLVSDSFSCMYLEENHTEFLVVTSDLAACAFDWTLNHSKIVLLFVIILGFIHVLFDLKPLCLIRIQ